MRGSCLLGQLQESSDHRPPDPSSPGCRQDHDRTEQNISPVVLQSAVAYRLSVLHEGIERHPWFPEVIRGQPLCFQGGSCALTLGPSPSQGHDGDPVSSGTQQDDNAAMAGPHTSGRPRQQSRIKKSMRADKAE